MAAKQQAGEDESDDDEIVQDAEKMVSARPAPLCHRWCWTGHVAVKSVVPSLSDIDMHWHVRVFCEVKMIPQGPLRCNF